MEHSSCQKQNDQRGTQSGKKGLESDGEPVSGSHAARLTAASRAAISKRETQRRSGCSHHAGVEPEVALGGLAAMIRLRGCGVMRHVGMASRFLMVSLMVSLAASLW